jgi:hypothetical protein
VLKYLYKLPPPGVDIFFTIIRSANSDSFHSYIIGFLARIFLPHLQKESQPLLGTMIIFTYSPGGEKGPGKGRGKSRQGKK